MVKVRRKPLFNRRYLQILVLILPAVILALHMSGRRADAFKTLRLVDSDRIYFLPTDDKHYQLDLLLPDSASLSDARWLQEQQHLAALKARLQEPPVQAWLHQHHWQAELQPHGGYRLLHFTMANLPTPGQRAELLDLLRQPATTDTKKLLPRLKAQRYLDNQDPQQRLLSAFGAKLDQAAPVPESPSHLATPSPRWTLTGPDSNHLPDQAWQGTQARQTQPSWSAQQDIIDTASIASDWRLIGQPLPAPTDAAQLAKQRLCAELIRRLLDTQSPRGSAYRWVWQPLPSGGYQALLLQHWSGDNPMLTLAAGMTDKVLKQVRQTLLDRLDTLSKENPQQWLDLIALYQLPPNSHEAFISTLRQVDLQQARALVSSALQPQHSLLLSFTNHGTTSP